VGTKFGKRATGNQTGSIEKCPKKVRNAPFWGLQK
jgi:hypothetical protein